MALFSFSLGDATYRLDLAFDDAAIVDDAVAFDLAASVERGGRTSTVAARIEVLPWEGTGRVTVEGTGVYEFTLTDRGGAALEQFLARVPVPDPILGCALKAGVSSLIGQAIKCRRDVEGEGLWGQIKAFAQCMRDHFGDIGRTALRRTFGCMISGGLL